MLPAVWYLVSAAVSAVRSSGHPASDPTDQPEGSLQASIDLVYQLHELAERVQTPPERDYELAARLYAQGVALDPQNAALRYNAGIVQKNLGNHRAAIEMYEAALGLDPSLRQADFNLARSLQMLSDQVDGYEDHSARTDDLMRALSHFDASVTSAEPGGLKNAEEVLYQLGRVEEARATYMKYVQLRPRGAVHAHDRLRCSAEEKDLSLREYFSNVSKLSAGALAPMSESTVTALCDLSLLSNVEEQRQGDRHKDVEKEKLDDHSLNLQPEYERLESDYQQRHHSAFQCPAALSGQHGMNLAAYYDVWHKLGLTYRENNPHSEDFLARGRHALDNEALSLFIADQLAPSVSAIVGAKVKTSFTKVAVMDETAYLPKHRDEATSEFTITAVLRAEIDSSPSSATQSTTWPIHLQQPPSGSSPAPEPLSIELGRGDCLFFNGRDFLHWRNYIDGHVTGPDRQQKPLAQPAARFTMLLLHYVHADFPESTCPNGDNEECILKQEYRQPLPDHLQPSEDMRLSMNAQELSGQCQANELCDADDWTSTIDGLHAEGGVEMVGAGSTTPRYLIYSPCVITARPGVCSQQFNNQFWALQHAVAVAEAMGRVLVLPEFMVIKTSDELLEEAAELAARLQQDGSRSEAVKRDGKDLVDAMLGHMIEKGLDQQWFPTGHFFDIEALKAASTYGVIEAQEFLQTVGYETHGEEDDDEDEENEEKDDDDDDDEDDEDDSYEDDSPVLRTAIVHPPYLVPRQDPRKIYDGAYYRQLGLRWLHGPPHHDDGWARPTRVSVHPEVVQAKSGRGQAPYIPGEGQAYWRSAEEAWTSQAVEVNALLTAEASLPADPGSAVAIDQLTSTVMTEHSSRLDNDTIGRLRASHFTTDDSNGEMFKYPGLQQQSSPRVIAFDFAPSYNFHVDRLRFDPELLRIRERFRWVEAVQAPAKRVEEALRVDAAEGGNHPSYVAIHLRRRGYFEFCSTGLDFYNRQRFGVKVTEDMCWPSAQSVAEQVVAAASAAGTDRIFVATDDPDENANGDIQALRAKGLDVWLATSALDSEEHLGSELQPLVEQAVCAAADHFIGNLASTFSFAIAQERQVRGMALETMSFWNSGSAADIAAAGADKR